MTEHEMIELLIDAINQGTKKIDYEEAPFLHEAMNQYFEWSTGMTIGDIIGDLQPMTDKQIIIDDLDTRCPYHCNEKIGQCNNPSQETPHTYCINNKDCIYKQYARKEQECEELKEEVSLLKESNLKLQPIEDAHSLEKCYLQQLDQIKEQLEAYKMEAEEGKEINAELKAENEKLKQTLADIKEIAYDGYNNGQTSYATFQCEKIINKINEVEE